MHTETNIFVSNLQGRRFVGDPFKIARRYACFERHDPETDLKRMQLTGKAAAEAQDRLIEATRYAFDLPELKVDEQGNVTGFDDFYVFGLMVEFMDYCNKKKLSFESMLTLPNCTASASCTPPATGPTSAAPGPASISAFLMSAPSDSGSTRSEPSSAVPHL